MEEFKKDLKEHMAEDRADFKEINGKLDQLLGQWKLVGAVLGVISGLATGWIF